jgi:hypothetical protein
MKSLLMVRRGSDERSSGGVNQGRIFSIGVDRQGGVKKRCWRMAHSVKLRLYAYSC